MLTVVVAVIAHWKGGRGSRRGERVSRVASGAASFPLLTRSSKKREGKEHQKEE